MKSKIFLLLFLIALGILTYFAYPIVKNRYFESENATKNEKQEPNANATINNNNTGSSDEINNADADAGNEEDSVSNSEVKDEIDESGDTANITAEDCDNECLNFKDNAGDLKYCQNICGLSLTNESENCDSKVGSDKDYCFKNQAVAKTDLNICNSIADAKIKSSCKNRVTEDLLEQQ